MPAENPNRGRSGSLKQYRCFNLSYFQRLLQGSHLAETGRKRGKGIRG